MSPQKALLLTVVLLGAAAIVIGTTLAPRHHARDHSPFAGYSVNANVGSISADWNVPRILPGSKIGSASTWIGVQENNGPFIQVGITEDREFGVGKVNAFSFRVNIYRAFWSDSVLHFHPRGLFPVRAGDRIVAILRHADKRWFVAIADVNSDRQAVFSTRQEGASRFNQGEWLQEDPTIGRNHLLHYPHMGSVRFTSAKVNGRPLTHWFPERQRMRVRGSISVPTRIRGTSFRIQESRN
jgi:hypothetical protein